MNNSRLGSFKKPVTSEDGRNRRNDLSIRLRKEKKEIYLNKKRNVIVYAI